MAGPAPSRDTLGAIDPVAGSGHAREPRVSSGEERLFTRQFGLVMAGTAAAWLAHTMALLMLTPFVIDLGFAAVVGGIGMGVIAVCALLSRLVIGPRIDQVGGRTPAVVGAGLLVASSAGYVAATLVPSNSVSLALVLVGAASHGAGFGLMTTSTFTIVAEIAPLPRRGEAIGYWGAAQPIIQGLAATLGFAVVAAAGYTALYALVGLASLAAVLLFLALHGRATGMGPTLPVARLPRLEPAVVIPVLACGLLAFVGSALVLTVPLVGFSVGVENPGLFYLASAVSGVLGRLATGRLSDRLGRARVAVPGLALMTASLLMLLLGADAGMTVFILAGAAYGVAVAAAMPALQALIMDRSPASQRGRSSAGMGIALDIGFASGSIAVGFLVGLTGAGLGLLAAAVAPLVSIGLLELDRRRRAGAS